MNKRKKDIIVDRKVLAFLISFLLITGPITIYFFGFILKSPSKTSSYVTYDTSIPKNLTLSKILTVLEANDYEDINFEENIYSEEKIDFNYKSSDDSQTFFSLTLYRKYNSSHLYVYTDLDVSSFSVAFDLDNVENKKESIAKTGVGTWGPPIRLGDNSELVVIELKAK